MTEFKLSQLQPDFDPIVSQIQTELIQKDSWRNFSDSSTGKILIDLFASVLASSRFAIISAARESGSIHTARIPASVYSHARSLGIHLIRKKPAMVTANINNTGTTAKYIPKYSQFTVGDYKFFNRENIIFNLGVSAQDVTLYQGEVITASYTSDGRSFQYFSLGDPDFSIANEDIICYVGSTEYTRTILGLWNYNSTDTIFYESTLGSGKVEIIFGDDAYGKIPPINEEILFTYAKTDGKVGNNIPNGLLVYLTTDTDIVGTSSTLSVNGSDQLPHQIYRVIAPGLFAAQERASTRQDYKALTLTYPGVVDVVFRGQSEIAPGDKNYLNVIQIILLTENLFSNNEWNTYIAWLQSKSLWNIIYERVDAEAVTVNITADVYCFNKANLVEVRDVINNNLTNFLAPKTDCIGKNLYKSDIQRQIFLSGPNSIDYVVISNPVSDTSVTYSQYVNYGTITLNMYYTTR